MKNQERKLFYWLTFALMGDPFTLKIISPVGPALPRRP
jgi:hypothetical protein